MKDAKKYIKHRSWSYPDKLTQISIEKYKDDPCYEYAIELTKRDALQGAEALIHNLNSLQSRSGQQLPFSSINYGTCTLLEGRIITRAILDATLNGTGELKKTPIFPCSIFQWDEKINAYPGTPNYDLFTKALQCTAKRFYPNYVNNNWSTDTAGRMKDVEHKRAVLNKLDESEMQRVYNWVRSHEFDALHYKMVAKPNKDDPDSGTVIIDETHIDPVEIMSTMGKCKLQLI